MDRPRVVNYARMKRVSDALNPEPSGWEMNTCTKICVGTLFLGVLVLYKRWINKKQRSRSTLLQTT